MTQAATRDSSSAPWTITDNLAELGLTRAFTCFIRGAALSASQTTNSLECSTSLWR